MGHNLNEGIAIVTTTGKEPHDRCVTGGPRLSDYSFGYIRTFALMVPLTTYVRAVLVGRNKTTWVKLQHSSAVARKVGRRAPQRLISNGPTGAPRQRVESKLVLRVRQADIGVS